MHHAAAALDDARGQPPWCAAALALFFLAVVLVESPSVGVTSPSIMNFRFASAPSRGIDLPLGSLCYQCYLVLCSSVV